MSTPKANADLYLSENIRESFLSISETEFERFFDSLTSRKLREVEGAQKKKDLTRIRDQVKMISELKGTFLALRMQAKREKENQ